MYRTVIVVAFLFSCCGLFAQTEDSAALNQEIEEVKIIQNFQSKYRYRLAAMRRVYPMALEAKKILEEHQSKLEKISKKRKRKQLGKQTHKRLKDEFNYSVRDLYIGEGALLIRLIHRETDMTVAEIIENFEGKTRRKWYNGLAKLGGQNLENRYDPKGKDYITELIIQEIEEGSISFSLVANSLNRQEFKQGMKDYRGNIKDIKKQNRRNKRKKRKA